MDETVQILLVVFAAVGVASTIVALAAGIYVVCRLFRPEIEKEGGNDVRMIRVSPRQARPEQEIMAGSILVITCNTEIFAAPESGARIGTAWIGDEVVAAGPPQAVSNALQDPSSLEAGHADAAAGLPHAPELRVPIQPKGAVDAAAVQLQSQRRDASFIPQMSKGDAATDCRSRPKVPSVASVAGVQHRRGDLGFNTAMQAGRWNSDPGRGAAAQLGRWKNEPGLGTAAQAHVTPMAAPASSSFTQQRHIASASCAGGSSHMWGAAIVPGPRGPEDEIQREFMGAAEKLSEQDLRDFVNDHISMELAEIRRMPSLEQRQQAFRSLSAEWHPDKCPAIAGLATEVFQTLQAQKSRTLHPP